MRWLIDGYNVMHAAGRLDARLGREGFRRARRRFLDDVSAILPVEGGHHVTLVFDANVPPGDFPISSTYRGMHVLFALGDEDADSRIEAILARDSNPRTLTVVSSDRRIRQAASRRRAHPLTADEFWDLKDHFRAAVSPPIDKEMPADRNGPPDAREAAEWAETFRDAEDLPGLCDALSPGAAILTDAEIAEIQRAVDRES
jgi:predicted RNA-binding protein with PIN domain